MWQLIIHVSSQLRTLWRTRESKVSWEVRQWRKWVQFHYLLYASVGVRSESGGWIKGTQVTIQRGLMWKPIIIDTYPWTSVQRRSICHCHALRRKCAPQSSYIWVCRNQNQRCKTMTNTARLGITALHAGHRERKKWSNYRWALPVWFLRAAKRVCQRMAWSLQICDTVLDYKRYKSRRYMRKLARITPNSKISTTLTIELFCKDTTKNIVRICRLWSR